MLWPLQRFKDSRGQHLLHREALNYGVDLEPQHFEQDEPVRLMTKELHTEAGTMLPQRAMLETETEDDQASAEDVPPHMPHARWETATTTAMVSTTSTSRSDEHSGRYIYTWQLGEWSKCSQECGAAGSGLQVSVK